MLTTYKLFLTLLVVVIGRLIHAYELSKQCPNILLLYFNYNYFTQCIPCLDGPAVSVAGRGTGGMLSSAEWQDECSSNGASWMIYCSRV